MPLLYQSGKRLPQQRPGQPGSVPATMLRNAGAGLGLMAALLPLTAAAIDLQPGDVRTPPVGMKLVTTSLVSRTFDGIYRYGEKQPLDGKLQTNYFVVRAGASFSFDDKPAFMYAQQSYGELTVQGDFVRLGGGADSASGAVDTIFAFGLWPYTNRNTDTHVAVAGYLMLPSGEHRHERLKLNPGENRYRWALQTGFHQGLTEKLAATAAFDTLWSGNNDDFGPNSSTYAQKPIFNLQAGLQYLITPRIRVGAMLFHSFGGETAINGIARDDRNELNRYQLTAVTDTAVGRFTLQHGSDLYTREGPKEKQHWILRYTIPF